MAESSQAVARKRNYYLQIMQTARQMDDQNLVRIILKKLTDLGLLTGDVSKTSVGKVIPIPTIYALSKTLDREQHTSDFLTSHKKKGGDKMDKKVVTFYSLFMWLTIGGSLFFCLWLYPKYLAPDDVSLEEIRRLQAGMVRSQPSNDLTNANGSAKDKIAVNHNALITQMVIVIGAICIVLLVGLRLKKRLRQNKPVDVAGYIFKITRITNKNEYDVFRKAAEDWPVPAEQIENDFQRFVVEQRIPYYVNDFIRKNKKHIDELRIPLFMGDWFYF